MKSLIPRFILLTRDIGVFNVYTGNYTETERNVPRRLSPGEL